MMKIKDQFAFRFVFIFFLLLIFPFPFNIIPGFDFLSTGLSSIYEIPINWIAEYVFSLDPTLREKVTGSGDTTYDYIKVFFFLSTAILGAISWTLLKRGKASREGLNQFFLALLRYYLGVQMLSYGLYKVFPLQFSEPAFYRLLQPYGESSPMGLAWTFLGYSENYSLFAGLSEVIGGMLLFHRRTATLGSLIVVGVMTNVFAMNVCYDIPVKLFSFELLLMALLIGRVGIKRILDIILFNRSAEPLNYDAYFKTKKWNIGVQITKWGLIACFLFTNLQEVLEGQKTYGKDAPKSPLYGLYDVVEFVDDGDTLPPLLTDNNRWRHLLIEQAGFVHIYNMDRSQRYFMMDVDTLEKTMNWQNRKDSTEIANFHYERTDTTFVMDGYFRGDKISCKGTI